MKLKRCLAIIFSSILFVSLCASPAFAAGEFVEMSIDGASAVAYNDPATFLADLQSAAEAEISIKLLDNVEISGYVPVAEGQKVQFDLNGYTLSTGIESGTGDNTRHYYAIHNYGTLQILDSSENQSGTIRARGIQNLENGDLIIDGGTIEAVDALGGAAIWNEASLIINNGTFKAVHEGVSGSSTGAGCLNNSGTATIYNGVFAGNNIRTYAIISTGNITVEYADVTGKHGALAVDSGTAVVNGGTYTSEDYYGLYVSNDGSGQDPEQALVTVTGGEFDGKTTSVWIGSDVNTAVNSTIEIQGGVFKKNINAQKNTRENAVVIKGGEINGDIIANAETENNIVVEGGKIDGNLSDNVVVKGGTFTNPDVLSMEVTIAFVPNVNDLMEDGNQRVYDIMVQATDDKIINRLTSAELKFALKPLADDEGNTGSVTFAVMDSEHTNIIPGADGEYAFYFDGLDGVSAQSGNEVKIGEVVFSGYGKFAFAAISGDALKVNATKASDNIVSAYTTNGTGVSDSGKLTVNSALSGTEINESDLTAPSLLVAELEPATKTLTVNIAFPNAVVDNAASYQDMTVTISGGDLGTSIVKELGSDELALTAGGYTLTQELTQNLLYTVTVEGAGYRTARYTVTMTEDKTLTFWNNVKDEATVVETGNDASKVKTTFLAGDILQDNQINLYDLSAVVSYFGEDNLAAEHPEYAKYDLNRDGKIDSKDVAMVLVSWGN